VSAEGSNAGGRRRGRRPHGQTILRGRYDGEFDRTNLPDDVILTNYFTVRHGRIVTLIIIATASSSDYRMNVQVRSAVSPVRRCTGQANRWDRVRTFHPPGGDW